MTLLIFCHIRPTGSAVTGDSTTVDSHTKQHVEGMGACPKGGGWLFPGGRHGRQAARGVHTASPKRIIACTCGRNVRDRLW